MYKREDKDDTKWTRGANGQKYHLAEQARDFYQSSDYCESIGGSLATILDEKDQAAVKAFITQSKTDLLWIGKA